MHPLLCDTSGPLHLQEVQLLVSGRTIFIPERWRKEEGRRRENDSAPAVPRGPRLSPRHSAESYPLPIIATLSPYYHLTNIYMYVEEAIG